MKASETLQKTDDIAIMKAAVLIATIMMAVGIVFGSCTCLKARAEESVTYTYITTFGRQPTQSDIENNIWYYYTDTLVTNIPMAGYGTVGGSCGWLQFYNGKFYIYSYGVGGKVFTSLSGSAYTSSSGQTMNPFQYSHESVETNIPLFSTIGEAKNYLLTGDTTGILNGYDYDSSDITKQDVNYCLTGFDSDHLINAVWTGATEPHFVPDNEEVDIYEYVRVSAVYDTSVDILATVELSDYGYSVTYSDISTTEKPLRALRFTPFYSQTAGPFGTFFYGSGLEVEFDETGNIVGIDDPYDLLPDDDHGGGGVDSDGNIVDREDINGINDLGYLQGVVYTNETGEGADYGLSSPYCILDIIKWDTSKDLPDARIEIRADCYLSSDKSKSSRFIYRSYADDVMYKDGIVVIPDEYIGDAWIASRGDIGFYVGKPVVENYYIRLIDFDEEAREYHVGGWTRISTGNVFSNNITTGEFNKDGSYEQDKSSDDSYEHGINTDGNGNYGAFDWNSDGINWFSGQLTGMIAGVSKVADMFSVVFGFLPAPVTWLLGGAVVLCVALRIFGR